MHSQEQLEKKVAQLEAECKRLREENRRLRGRLDLPLDEPAHCVTADAAAPLNQG
jgi:cell division protein FtsB